MPGNLQTPEESALAMAAGKNKVSMWPAWLGPGMCMYICVSPHQAVVLAQGLTRHQPPTAAVSDPSNPNNHQACVMVTNPNTPAAPTLLPAAQHPEYPAALPHGFSRPMIYSRLNTLHEDLSRSRLWGHDGSTQRLTACNTTTACAPDGQVQRSPIAT
jgi:hypothetical protein